MPKKKKNQVNAFSMYMQSILPDLRREGRVFPNGMADVVPIAHPRWQALPEKDKERFENMAKEHKRKMKGAEGDKYRQDNVGNIIAYRKDPLEEMRKRKEKEKREVLKVWPIGEDLVHEKFYLISFETLCETEDGIFLPCELGIVEYSLQDGITKSLQKFIEPGPIPLGYRYTCTSHSDETHQIPVSGFELASKNYLGIWNELENFVNPNGELEHYPPIFCLENQVRLVEYSMDWLHGNSCIGYANRLQKIFIFENILPEFYKHVGERAPSAGQCQTMLNTTVFDFEPNTRCPWHEDKGVKHCALATVKKVWYTVSDALSNIYNIDLKDSHMPSNTDSTPITVISPNAVVEPRAPRRQQHNNTSAYERLAKGKNNGPFAARDYRMQHDEDDNDSDPGTSKYAPAHTLRRPNVPSGVGADYEAPRAPWAASAPSGGGNTGGEEWPSLGGGPSSGASHMGRKTLAEAVRGNNQNVNQKVIVPSEPVRKPTIHEAVRAANQKYAGKTMAPSPDQAPAPPIEWQSQVKQGQMGPAARQALAVKQMQQRNLQALDGTNQSVKSESSWDPEGDQRLALQKNQPPPSPWSAPPPGGAITQPPAPQSQPTRQRVPNAWAGSAQVQAATAMQMTRAMTAPKTNPWNQPPPSSASSSSSQSAAPLNAWNRPPQPAVPSASAWARPPVSQTPASPPEAWDRSEGSTGGTSQAIANSRGRGRGLIRASGGAPLRPPPGLGMPAHQGLANQMAGIRLGRPQ